MSGSEMLTLEESAAVAGHARWLEIRLFEVLGAWVGPEADPAATVLWSTQSLGHAGGAVIWRDRQPRVAHLDRDALTGPAGPGVTALLDALAELAEGPDAAEPAGTLARLVAVARVVEPRRSAAYRLRCERASPLADGPTVRWTQFLLADSERYRAEAEALLVARMHGPGVEDEVRTVEARLGALLADDAGLTGLIDPGNERT